MSEPGNSGNGKPRRDYPEMMGDESEEQNLSQPGNKHARISEEEVADAFEEDDMRPVFWTGFTCGALATVLAICVVGRVRLRYY